ncbi:MAG: organic solvent ABC transporter ATP-binding protein [Candidatus Mesenet longicola]|uniref:Organic solvent ABC transporter ATP-binding protein n=1 Tax=Candidatus Mesenet longicola TaxID=1892558 RepID=A0A8J3MMH3_9RICK|nr:MAG: organic solvent ABC transporter ATP-binding protein [Candidatus Mesenet longicola]GHM59944.1 MAG: organic solvent ABC transporter ATP-binding protein [Candidatus Mesenet longicola]
MSNIISISDLHLSFGGRKILDGINLQVSRGESLVIIGESGSGKSVLTKIIIGLMSPDLGTIKINIPGNNKVLNFGVLFQNSALFDSITVWENISFNFKKRLNVSEKEAKKLAIDKLNMVRLSRDTADMFPLELSGGMKKRVALARAIAHSPQMIILDEPTSGLDPIVTDLISDIIIKLSNELNPTIITITHDIHSAFRIANKIAVLYHGKILFCGTVEEIKKTNNNYIKCLIKHAV